MTNKTLCKSIYKGAWCEDSWKNTGKRLSVSPWTRKNERFIIRFNQKRYINDIMTMAWGSTEKEAWKILAEDIKNEMLYNL
jgi:hypothetical protein